MSKKGKKHAKPNYAKQQRAQHKAAAAAAASPAQNTPQTTPQAPTSPTVAPTVIPTLHQVRVQAPHPGQPSTVVSLEALAPLIVRSGRPFDAQAGADKPRFPPPSTLTGCLRTAWARAHQQPFGVELATLTVQGPLLLRTDATGKTRWLVPKPADAQYYRQGTDARCLRRCLRLQPGAFAAGCAADLPQGLQPLYLSETVQGKPCSGPTWWDWEDLQRFRSGKHELSFAALCERGWSPPAGDLRTHVAIDATTQAAESGRLFQTQGLDLTPDNHDLQQGNTLPLRLLARCAEPLPAGLVHLGGERRLARLQPEAESLWPQPPQHWFTEIQRAGGLTLTLLTPGLFAAGYRPGWLDAELCGAAPLAPGLRLQLVAVAVERWQPHSGWDLARQEPRPTRKLAGAGSCYWFRLLTPATPEALARLWLNSVCDQEQDRRDGFGLALPAPWKPNI